MTARFLFATIPVPAHTHNALPFAARLVESGHQVYWYAGRAFHQAIEAAGALPVAYRAAPDGPATASGDGVPIDLHDLRSIRRTFAEVFAGQTAQRVRDLRRAVAQHQIDALLTDGLTYGAGLTAELAGLPWASFGDGPLHFPDADTPPFGAGLLPVAGAPHVLRNKVVALLTRRVAFAEAQRRYDRARADLGLPHQKVPVLEANLSPYLHLHGATPSFEYPRHNLPGHVHWVGPLRPDPARSWTPPSWWPEVVRARRPVVLVSQGSIRGDVRELIMPALAALQDLDVTVVVTTGRATPQEVVDTAEGTVPANVFLARFIPYDLLLPHVDVFVTNGGYTGVTLALSHGVPLVQAGTSEEKADIGARIAWTGTGVRLGTTRPSPVAVRRGVQAVLGESRFRTAARRMQQEMGAHDAGREGAALLAQLAVTRRPVCRDDVSSVLSWKPAEAVPASKPRVLIEGGRDELRKQDVVRRVPRLLDSPRP